MNSDRSGFGIDSMTQPARGQMSEALREVDVVSYDRRWRHLYDAERASLFEASASFLDIEHIGSTAVPGLRAKPIIDIMASVEVLADVQRMAPSLQAIAYHPIETGMKDRVFLRKIARDRQIYHLHIVEQNTWDGRKERIMRDFLLQHPEAATAYAKLKDDLAKAHRKDSLAYTRAKTDFIQALMNQACDERGLPRIDVWPETKSC
jgi:GrpB-like predicted nucleotidyltransferase (UPF0157 family)